MPGSPRALSINIKERGTTTSTGNNVEEDVMGVDSRKGTDGQV